MNMLLLWLCRYSRQPRQAFGLAFIERGIAFRVVPDQNLTKGGADGLDVFVELFTVLKVELIEPLFSTGHDVMYPCAAASRRMAAPNCSSTRIPALSLGAPAATAALKPS